MGKNMTSGARRLSGNAVTLLITALLCGGSAALIYSGAASRQISNMLISMACYIVMAVSLNLVVGLLGELSLGHAGFMSVGLFTGCLLSIQLAQSVPIGVRMPLSMLLGGVAAAVVGLLVGLPALRLKGVLTHEEMEMLVDVARQHDLFFIGDEAYREFVYAGEPLQSFGEFTHAAENVILIDTVSKRFSACGARIGCLISRNRELMAHAMKYAQCRLAVPTLDQLASAALYQVGPEYFAATREEYKRRRDTVVRKLQQIPGVVCKCPKGAFYLMAALPVDDADTFQQWLLEEFEDHGDTVMFAPGEPFYGTPGKGKNEIRIAYVLKQQDLERAMDLLALGIRAYQQR